MTHWQRTLFDLGDRVGLEPVATDLTRTPLGPHAWLELRPGWVRRHDLLFEDLAESVPWVLERRPMYDRTVDVPRLVASYGAGDALPHPLLGDMWDVLGRRYPTAATGPLCSVGACLYRNGVDSVAWHGDRNGRGTGTDSVVAIVSLGARRRLLLRPVAGGPALRFALGAGDLLVMGGRCQQHWEHCVPKTTRPVGPRISIQFRTGGATAGDPGPPQPSGPRR
jgi:alkylated DNA repair dioxygenase AlkB